MTPQQDELIREDVHEMNVIFVHSKIDDLGLSVWAFRVYSHLARRAGSPSGCAWPAIATIADVCKIGETKVREALKELIDRRMIDRQPREQATYLFRLTPPSIWRGEGFATRTPSPDEPVRHANPPGSPREPEGYPLKVIQDTAGAVGREAGRTLPASLNTGPFKAAWEKWVVHWSESYARGAPIPIATSDSHLAACLKLGPIKAVEAIENAISRGLREPSPPFQKNDPHRPNPTGGSRRPDLPGDYREAGF